MTKVCEKCGCIMSVNVWGDCKIDLICSCDQVKVPRATRVHIEPLPGGWEHEGIRGSRCE